MTILKIQEWRPDTHPGYVVEEEWEYDPETRRDTGREHRGVANSDYATITLLKNDATTSLAVSNPAGVTGIFTDLIDTVDFAAGDTCANQIVALGTTGDYVSWISAGLLLEAST